MGKNKDEVPDVGSDEENSKDRGEEQGKQLVSQYSCLTPETQSLAMVIPPQLLLEYKSIMESPIVEEAMSYFDDVVAKFAQLHYLITKLVLKKEKR